MAGHHFQRPNGNFTCQVQHNWTHKENIPGEEESGEGTIPPLVENLEIEEKDSSASESEVGTDSEMDKEHNVETQTKLNALTVYFEMMVSQVGSTLSDGDEPLNFNEFTREVISDMREIFRSSKSDMRELFRSNKCAYKVTLDGD